MKRLSVLMMILFISACSNGETEQSEADTQEEAVETQEKTDDSDALTELEKENETLRKNLAEKEKAEAEEEAAEETNNESNEDESAEERDVDSEETEAELETDQDTESVEKDTIKVAANEFTDEEQQEMNQLFYDWAIERAEIGGMAVTQMYFSHGAAGRGDWYAMTPDGEVQTQNQDNPGFDHFDIHAIGGVAFYTPVSGDVGADENAPSPSTAAGYSELALPDTNIHKYMLADNGVVYELIGKREQMSFSAGFSEYDDDGTRGPYAPRAVFVVSGDQDAQQEWKRILGMYQE